MKEERNILDICNDINEILENYETDKKYIDHSRIDNLKEELFNVLNKKKNADELLDNSFVCLTLHLYKSINNDKYIDWEHIGLYNDIYQMIENIFPNIGNKNIINTTYKKLHAPNKLIKSNRKHY